LFSILHRARPGIEKIDQYLSLNCTIDLFPC
jgi:hypothetical protein